MVDAKPRVIFVADGKEITHRQMEALATLNDKGSMKKAAASLWARETSRNERGLPL